MTFIEVFSWLTAQASTLFFAFMGIVGIGFLIGFHELGHFLFCKLFYIRTPSFSIGFGPTIITKKIGETNFKLSAIPIGGYVEIAGSAEIGQGSQEEATREDEFSFATKPFYQKTLVVLGGIIFNILLSYLIFLFLYMSGMPKSRLAPTSSITPTIEVIEKNSPAERFGLHKGDTIIAIDNTPISDNAIHIFSIIQSRPNQKMAITVKRAGKKIKIPLITGTKEHKQKKTGHLGIILETLSLPPQPFFKALKQAIQTTHQWIYQTLYGFLHLFRKRDVNNLAGPLMIMNIAMKSAEQGFKIFLLLLAIISVNLAVINIFPLPILDGGQLLFHGIEAIIQRPLSMRIKEYIHMGTWVMLLALLVYLSAKDIARIAHPQIEAITKFLGLS